MSENNKSFLKKIVERIFPEAPDFFGMLKNQMSIVAEIGELMLDYMESGSEEIGKKILEQEEAADVVKSEILFVLNDAFSTPIDRENIYRSVMNIENIANYCKATITEMQIFELKPNKFDVEIAIRLRDGINALHQGFSLLATSPKQAVDYCNSARKEERRIENLYKQALRELFQGTDYNYIFKRREVYRHLSNVADQLTSCSNSLQDIVVKIT